MAESESVFVELEKEFASLRAGDDRRNAAFTRLLDACRGFETDCVAARQQTHEDSGLITTLREEVQEANEKIQELQADQDRFVFANVLIDGDCTLFRDDLITLGREGGTRAAAQLKQAVDDEFQASNLNVPGFIIVSITVYASLGNLAAIYKDRGVITDAAVLADFARGFTMANKHCNFIDTGDGPDAVEEKVKAAFHTSLLNVHCRQVLFGGSSNANYAHMLRPYIEDDAARARITIVKSQSFAPELGHLQGRFRIAAFPKVFSVEQPPGDDTDAISSIITPPLSDSDLRSPRRLKLEVLKPSRRPRIAALLGPEGSAGILQNGQGHRVDTPLKYSAAEWRHVKGQKLCYHDHLLGRCPWANTPKGCQLKHGAALTDGQVAALTALARRTPCSARLACRNAECLSGHRCIQDDCPIGGCRFPPEMHNVDTRLAN